MLQLLKLEEQSKIVHHGNNELKRKVSQTFNMQFDKLSLEEKGKVKK